MNLTFTIGRCPKKTEGNSGRGYCVKYPVRQKWLYDGFSSGWYKRKVDAQRRCDELNSSFEFYCEMALQFLKGENHV